MTRPTPFVFAASAAFCSTLFVPATSGQEGLLTQYEAVSDQHLQNPPPEDWLMWRRTYDLSGHSPLTQISRANAANLALAWQAPLSQGGNMTTPLVHDGVMFIADTGNRLLALDARSGEQLWAYVHESENFDGRRIGVALHGDKVIVPHNDMTMVALNVRTGAVEWTQTIDTPVKDVTGGYYALRSAPVIADGVIVQGVTATAVPQGGFIFGLDLETGAELWRFYTVARPDTPGGETWNDLTLEERSGGSVWIPGSYDADLDLIFFGTAPTYDTAPLLPDLNIAGVSNDALYTNTTLALRPATGELVWHYQHIENDQWDLDWAFERQIINISFEGEQRKAVINMGKLGILDAVDAATGEFLFSMDMGLQNVVTAINPETGYKTINPYTIPQLEEQRLICSNHYGAKSWPPAAFNPITRKLFLPLNEGCLEVGPDGRYQILTTNIQMREALFPGSNGNMGRIQALDLDTQEFDWRHRQPSPVISSILATAGGIVFAGDLNRHFRAFDDDTGEILWEALLDDVPSSTIITYEIEGIQYVAIVAGQTGYHVNDWARMYGIFAEPEGMPVNDAPKGGAAIWVYALEH